MYEIFEELCKEKGVKPYRVSKDTGIATATLSDWKTGKSQPKEDKIQILAKYFNVTPDYLRGTSKYKTAIEKWRDCISDEELERVKKSFEDQEEIRAWMVLNMDDLDRFISMYYGDRILSIVKKLIQLCDEDLARIEERVDILLEAASR